MKFRSNEFNDEYQYEDYLKDLLTQACKDIAYWKVKFETLEKRVKKIEWQQSKQLKTLTLPVGKLS